MHKFSICPLASGSKGNSYLITNGKTNILLDCGISLRSLKEGIIALGKTLTDISAIAVTHEHSDHIKGIGSAVRRLKIPVYATLYTWRAMYKSIAPVPDEIIKVIEKEKPFYIEDIKLCAFAISHDAADPVGYSFFSGGKKISVVTDTGIMNENILNSLKGSQIVLIEANHDKNMLAIGRYPFALKRRISGECGHLSNEDAAYLAALLAKEGAKTILLGHLSEENNYPELAAVTVKNAFTENGIKEENQPFLYVIPPKCIGKIFWI